MNNLLLKVTDCQHYKFSFIQLKNSNLQMRELSPQISALCFNLIQKAGKRNKNLIEINLHFETVACICEDAF